MDENAFLFVYDDGADAVLRSSENPRLILLVSSVDRIEVMTDALFEGIVRPSSVSLLLTCAGSATEGPAMRAVCMVPRKHSTAPWKSA
jgi:hypothetical protein